MRKQLLLAVLVACSCIANAQYVNIPDSTFRTYLKTEYPGCFNAAGQMDTTCSAVINDTDINMGNMPTMKSLDGIQYFKKLKYLSVQYGYLDTIPSLPRKIVYLTLTNNKLRHLPPLPDSLQTLSIMMNYDLTTLPPLPPKLRQLIAGPTGLTSLPPLPDSLKLLITTFSTSLSALPPLPNGLLYLDCSINNLSGILPPLPSSLIELECAGINLTALPALPAGLTILDCSGNQITALPATLPVGLTKLSIGNNFITSLPPLPSTLTSFDCSYDQIGALPLQLPAGLNTLVCYNCNLSTLPPLPSTLQELEVYNNNIYCLPALPKTLYKLAIDTNKIACIPNSGTGLNVYVPSSGGTDYLPNGYPICSVVSNKMGCTAFPVIAGNIFYDLNSNGLKDAGEYDSKYIRVNLSNGTFSFSNNYGQYELSADTIGSFTLTANPPPYFNVVPVTSTFTFSSNDTIVTRNLALQPTVAKDSVSIFVTPIAGRATPGFQLTYMVSYRNNGTTNLPATDIFLAYDGSLLTYNAATNPLVTNASNTLTLHLPALPVGSADNFNATFTVSAAAPLGSSLAAGAVIINSAVTDVDSSRILITGAFDPNDKTATPSISRQQVINGDYIEYTIRFQNTGTDLAYHVVVTDTLQPLLQAGTFQMLETSHTCNATVKGNAVSFEMRNIMLPDSNVNEPASHGFIRFRVKPVNTLVAGNTVNNKAAIYFDYNKPVITNTAVTNITAQALPLKLITFTGERAAGDIHLYWQSANELNTKRFIVQQSSGGREYFTAGTVAARGTGNNNYNYIVTNAPRQSLFFRLQMEDRDGSYTYSPVILIKDISKAGFVLQQNPVQDKIVLSSITQSLIKTEAALVNNMGVVVKRFTIRSATQTIAVGDLSSGTYYLRTQQGNEKVLIMR